MDHQDRINLLVAAFVLTLAFAAYWLMTELDRRGKLEQCLMARRRDCEQYAR